MIVAANDTCTFPDEQIETFAQAREPKRLVIHPGGHFDTYTEHFELTSRAARDWFVEHLWPAAMAEPRAPHTLAEVARRELAGTD